MMVVEKENNLDNMFVNILKARVAAASLLF